MQLFNAKAGFVSQTPHAYIKPARGIVDQQLGPFQDGLGMRQAGAVPVSVNTLLFGIGGCAYALPDAAARLINKCQLLHNIRDNALCSVCRGGCAHICRQVDQCPVILMPNSRYDWGNACSGGAHYAFIGKTDQVFKRAAAPRNDDHINVRVGIKLADSLYDFRRALCPLHMHMFNSEVDSRPAEPRISHDIALSARLGGAYYAYPMGEFRDRHFMRLVKQPFPLELLAQLFYLLAEVAFTNPADIIAYETQACAFHPYIRVPMHNDLVPLDELRSLRCKHPPP